MKAKKLKDGSFEIEETINSSKKKSVINKVALEQAIKELETLIADKQILLTYKEELLSEIKKVQ